MKRIIRISIITATAAVLGSALFFIPSAWAKTTPAVYQQEEFQFYDDSTGTTLNNASAYGGAAENANLTSFPIGSNVRLRYSIYQTANKPDQNLSYTPSLEYKAGATNCADASGWTTVPTETSCGSSPICQATSAKFATSDSTTNRLLSGTFVSGGNGIETDGSPATTNFTSGTVNQEHAEYEWMLEVTSNASGNTAYTLRIPMSSGTYTNCAVLTTETIGPPSLTVQAPADVTADSLTANGTITALNGSNATLRGFVYDTVDRGNPGNTAPGASSWTYSTSTSGDFGTGSFSEAISDLTDDTTYFIRSFAQNSQGYAYSSTAVSTTTQALLAPSLTVEAPTDVSGASLTANGTITSTGGQNATLRGFVYDTSDQGDPGNTAPGASAWTYSASSSGDFGTGSFTEALSDLSPDTTYFIRSFAQNPQGYAYSGTAVSTSTLADKALGDVPYALRVTDANTAEFIIVNGGAWHAATSTTNINDGSWHHIMATYDGSDMKMYVNGTLEDTYSGFSGNMPQNALEFRIGADYATPVENTTHGFLDEVRVSNTARSAAWAAATHDNAVPAQNFITWGTVESGGGPVAHWSFNEGYGSTTYDGIGVYDGTLQGGASWTDGKFGKALSFNGTTDYVDGGDVLDIRNTDMTITAWVQPTTLSPAANAFIVSKSDTSSADGRYAVGMSTDGKVRGIFDPGTAVAFNSTRGLSLDWNHIAAVYDRDGDLSLYINGVYDNGQSIAAGNGIDYDTTKLFQVGAYGSDLFFPGLIDEVKVYNRALTPDEILAEHNGSGIRVSNPAIEGIGAGPVGEWRFEGTSATTVYDTSGNSNDGTLSGSTTRQRLGKAGSSLRLDGALATIADSASLDITNAVTVRFWVKVGGDTCGDPIQDADGNTYSTAMFGTDCWMTENLRVGTRVASTTEMTDNATIEKYCYNDTDANCVTDGGLYQWDEAMQYAASCNGTGASPSDACATPVQGICPDGWHLPSHYEWTTLTQSVCSSGTCTTDFPYDVSTTGYRGTDEGARLANDVTGLSWFAGTTTDSVAFGTSGFDLPASGYRLENDGSYYNRTGYSYIWASTETSAANGWLRYVAYSNAGVNVSLRDKGRGASVRCLRD